MSTVDKNFTMNLIEKPSHFKRHEFDTLSYQTLNANRAGQKLYSEFNRETITFLKTQVWYTQLPNSKCEQGWTKGLGFSDDLLVFQWRFDDRTVLYSGS